MRACYGVYGNTHKRAGEQGGMGRVARRLWFTGKQGSSRAKRASRETAERRPPEGAGMARRAIRKRRRGRNRQNNS